ncbi:MAG: tol-pal system protein YbgF [Magnetococcales bacterium]|nr:tol-pal system protein YbgF [Magnetococcales bacterium]
MDGNQPWKAFFRGLWFGSFSRSLPRRASFSRSLSSRFLALITPRLLSLSILVALVGCGAKPPPAGTPGAGAEQPAAAASRGEEVVQEAPLEKEVKRLSKTVATLGHSTENSQAGASEMAKRIDLMEKEMGALRGELEVARHDNKRLQDQVADLNQKSVQAQPAPTTAIGSDSALAAASAATTPAAAPTTPAAVTPAKAETTQVASAARTTPPPPAKNPGQKPASADQAYTEANQALRSGQYVQAGAAFRNFIKWFPDDARVPRAQYWIGETHYVQRQFREALQEFSQILQRWPKSDMVPGCLLKIGFSLYELEEWNKARAILNRLIKEFPDAPAVHQAKQRLKKMAETQPKGQKEKEEE